MTQLLCRDYLGGNRFKQLILNEHPQGYGAGIFTEVDGFGNSLPLSDELCKTGRTPWLRHQGMWKDGHHFTRKDFPTILKRARGVEELARAYPTIGFGFSPMCEHEDMSKADLLEILGKCEQAAPSCEIINTPSSKGLYVKGYTNEVHGFRSTPPKGFKIDFSFDGTSQVNSNLPEFLKNFANAGRFYGWEPNDNGNAETNSPPVPRPQRTCWMYEKLNDSMIYQLNNERGKVRIPRAEFEFTYKSHAENKGNGDPRADKPVILMVPKVARVELVSENGQLVGAAPRYKDPFADGRWRYYFDEWGFIMAEKARRLQGHSVVRIRVDGQFIGKLNPAFRME